VIPLIVCGASGRMGRMLIQAVTETPGVRLAAAIERPGTPELGRDAGALVGLAALGVVLTDDLGAALEQARGGCIVDFTAPAATEAAAALCARAGVGMVVGTTGLGDSAKAALERASAAVPVLVAANFSLGVNVLLGLAEQAARLLEGFDMEVVEIHHGKKRDAPSGTALRLAEALAEGRGQKLSEAGVYARQGDVGPRTPGEIGVMALRGGDVVGEHTAFLFGPGERVELTHRATSRTTFAHGAVRAGRWLAGKPAGRYDMRDVLGLRGPAGSPGRPGA